MRLGIVGGLGPETSCLFCLNVNNKIIKQTKVQPDIVMENVPMSESVLQRLAHGDKPSQILALLSQSVTRLNLTGCDIIAIPCNTVHVFIDELRLISKVPIISIIEESAKVCENKKSKIVGLLASSTSIKTKLHILELEKRNIRVITPFDNQQEEISKIIVNIVTNKVGEFDKKILTQIATDLKNRGADTIMLACTDLRMIWSQKDFDLAIVETTNSLENAVVKKLMSD